MGRNGNGAIRGLAKRMDLRFARMEEEIGELRTRIDRLDKNVRGLRRDTRTLFGHVVTLDDELRAHRRDKTAHFVPAR